MIIPNGASEPMANFFNLKFDNYFVKSLFLRESEKLWSIFKLNLVILL